jgi:hypothetical protein
VKRGVTGINARHDNLAFLRLNVAFPCLYVKCILPG